MAPFLLASTVPAQDQINALMRMTRADRDEVPDTAKGARLTLLGLSICDLAAESRTAKQNWIRVRESAALVSRYVDGGSFIHNIPDTTPAVWGLGDDVFWAEGEGLIVARPQVSASRPWPGI